MSSLAPETIRCRDLKEGALAFLLRGGLNKVLWDECHAIWEPLHLLEDLPAADDKMGIFGVKGKLRSDPNEVMTFQLRYELSHPDGSTESAYHIHAAVAKPSSDGALGNVWDENANFVHEEGSDRKAQEHEVTEAIRTLTAKVESEGLQTAIRQFMTPRSD